MIDGLCKLRCDSPFCAKEGEYNAALAFCVNIAITNKPAHDLAQIGTSRIAEGTDAIEQDNFISMNKLTGFLPSLFRQNFMIFGKAYGVSFSSLETINWFEAGWKDMAGLPKRLAC